MHQQTEKPKFAPALNAMAKARSLPVIAIYAIVCLFWVGFDHWIGPTIIAAARAGKTPSILSWSFHDSSPLPVEHYVNVWNTLSRAVELALILHLAIVLFVRAIDRKHSSARVDNAAGVSRINLILLVFSAAFLGLCIVIGPRGDYVAYIREWRDVLEGSDPWHLIRVDSIFGPLFVILNVYGPLFNVLAPFIWITPLANKLLFAFAYLAYVIWLIKDFGPERGLVPLSWPVIVFWLVNPFSWIEIVVYGHLDVLLALACVAAVHGQMRGKNVFSGASLAIGILLKFLPIVILPFLTFNKRRFHFGLLSTCVALVIAGMLLSVLIWGKSTFAPLIFAATRRPAASIYEVLSGAYSPLRLFWAAPNVDWLEKPLGLAVGLGVFTWSMVRRIGPALSAVLAVLVTLLFYRLGDIKYQMVLFLLISYWAVSAWKQLQEHTVLSALVVGYFSVLAVVDIAIWSGLEGYTHYSVFVVSFKFLLGCALLATLIQFSALTESLPKSELVEDQDIPRMIRP